MVRYRLAHRHTNRLAPLGEHLARQQRHFKIKLDSQPLAQIGDGIEAPAVARLDLDRDNVAVVKHSLFDHGRLPLQIDNTPFYAPRT